MRLRIPCPDAWKMTNDSIPIDKDVVQFCRKRLRKKAPALMLDPCLTSSRLPQLTVIKRKVSDISESTNRPAMLCAPLRSAGPPTMVLGGFAMHRISGGDQKSVRFGSA